MRAVTLLLAAVALSALLWGCASQQVRCDTRLRPINIGLPAVPVYPQQGAPR